MKNGRLTHFGIVCASIVATTLVAAGCGDNKAVDGLDVVDGSLNGELAIYISDDFEGRTETKYALRSRNGDERSLIFDSDPRLTAGSMVKVWGTETADSIRVTSFKVMAPPAERVVTSALRMGSSYPSKRLAFVVVDIGGGVSVTQAQAQDELTGPVVSANDPPLRNYYVEASYGTQDLDGQAFQLSYPMSACNTAAMATALKPMVNAMGGGTFNHYLWFFGSRLSACAWSGLGEVGTPDRASDDTWYNNSRSCVVMVQEPGHNFGMQHSSSMRCPSTPFADAPNGTCTHSEYGDRFDPMGGACDHMNGWQKAYNGWLQGCNVVRARQSGTFTLVPIELPCDGVQLLQIPMPKTRPFARSGGGGTASTDMLTHYYLELRTPRSLDAGTPISVQVRVSGDTLGRNQRAVHTWILDMNPATTGNAWDGLVAGGKFDDPAGGVSFQVTEIDMDHATVVVTMDAMGGGPVCLDKTTPFTAPGPGIESCNPTPAVPGGAVGGMSGSTGGSPGSGGRPGTGGRGGNAGTGGAPGLGGRGGTTGTGGSVPGTGGTPTTGTGGMAGTGGTPPASGGAPGSGGQGPIIGTGGTPGTGGSLIPGSGGGGGPLGTGGASTGVDAGSGIGPVVTGGCSCSTSPSAPASGGGMLALFGMLVLAAVRGRQRRRS